MVVHITPNGKFALENGVVHITPNVTWYNDMAVFNNLPSLQLNVSESKIKRESPRNSLLRNQNLSFGSEKNVKNRE